MPPSPEPSRYDTFDASEIQFETRRSVWRLSGLGVAAVTLTVAGLALGRRGLVSTAALTWMLFATWFGCVWIVSWRLRRLRRAVWCVKIGAADVVGYDYARRPIALPWHEVERVDVTDDGLVVVASPYCFFEVPARFPQYAALSHRLVWTAERQGVAVHLDGVPWERLDVYRLYPFLQDPPAHPPETPAT
jgi:hypothetical protein